MKGSGLTILLIIVGSTIVIGMVCFIVFKDTEKANVSSVKTDSATQNSPAIPVKDYAPNIPMSQKTIILIQTSDSSDIKYIVPANQVATYVKSLPPGYHVVTNQP